MASNGYSKRSLSQKLGIGQDAIVAVVELPERLPSLLDPLPPGARLVDAGTPANMLLCFATTAASLDVGVRYHLHLIPPDGSWWACWPKRASKVPTDITESVCRDLFLPLGLVDVKVIAIDETWSGLKFVVRKELRDTWPPEVPTG